MTDTVIADRIALLQQRRANSDRCAAPASTVTASSAPAMPQLDGPAPGTARRRRTDVTSGSKVAAAGFGFAAMLGLVAAMGIAGRRSGAEPPPAQLPVAPAKVVVVIHPADSTTTPVATSAPVDTSIPASPVTTLSSEPIVLSAQPIVLSAQPTVRQAPASQAPTGQTNGSR